jgi:hypothetical protein
VSPGIVAKYLLEDLPGTLRDVRRRAAYELLLDWHVPLAVWQTPDSASGFDPTGTFRVTPKMHFEISAGLRRRSVIGH